MPPFVGYHGLTGQEHQQRVDTLAPQYRITFRWDRP